MKKIIFLIFLVACLGSCKRTYDNIADFVTEETVYPGRFDTIIGKIGFERVELELLKAGRLPASKITLGKAKNTVVEYDGKKVEYDSICSWVSITGLTQPKLYRFKVYTTDENGYKSVTQEIALKPFVSSDYGYLLMASPLVTSSPWALELKWPQPSSVLLEYVDLTYKYTDKDGVEITGKCEKAPNLKMVNLEPGHPYSIDIRYRVVPKADNEMILDTTYLSNSYDFNTPTADEYQKKLAARGVNRNSYAWISGDLTINWNAVNDSYMQYTTLTYMDSGVEKELTISNTENTTVIPGFNLGTVLKIKSNYEVVGVAGAYIDSFDETFDPLIDLDRIAWKCVYTSLQPATDGYPSGTDPSPGAHNAHIDGDIRTMLSMAKIGKSVNGSVNNGTYQMPMVFVLDLQKSNRFNYLRVHHRTTDTGDGLRVRALQILGTNNYEGPVNKYTNPTATSATEDPTRWENIAAFIEFPSPRTVESPNMMIPLGNYRYVKIEYKSWDTANNSACQMSEFYLGIKSSNYQAD